MLNWRFNKAEAGKKWYTDHELTEIQRVILRVLFWFSFAKRAHATYQHFSSL